MDIQLINHQYKCRCCFKVLTSNRKTVAISKSIEKRFFELTKIKLILTELYSNVICESCNSKLSECADFQNELIDNQMRLYQFFPHPTESELLIKEIQEEFELEERTRSFKCEAVDEEIVYQIEALDETLLVDPPSEQKPTTNFTENDEHSKIPEWSCNLCKTDFRTRLLLRSHMSKHKDPPKDKNYRSKPKKVGRRMCQLCGLSFASNGWYHHILRAHTENVRFVCDFCNKGFKVKHDLKDHIQTHMNVESRKKYKCPHCPAVLLSKAALKNHDHIFHSNIIEEHPCECGKIFGSRMKLYQHRTTVHMKGHYPCSQCDKSYTVKNALQKHIIKNHKEKVPCDVCGKPFAPGMFMNRHMKTHGPASFQCKVEGCTKLFHAKSALSYHHETQHTESETVYCATCNAPYNSVRNLNRHIKRQHNEVRVQCEVPGCTHSSARKDYLSAHYKSHKDIDENMRSSLLAKVKDIKVIPW